MTLAGKRVVVTGADGFIGSHLTERLVREGAKVRAMCLYNSLGSWGWLNTAPMEIRDAVEVGLGDVRDTEWVQTFCREAEVIFHLAALIAIPYSYQAPRSFVDTNVTGTLNVLEAARKWNVARVIHTSTSEVYGTPKTLPIRETSALNAQSPYAASKLGADQLALSYHRSFGVPVTVLRPFNTYGPRQSTRAVLPTILTQLIEGKKEIVLGRLDTKRDMTFVTDTVDGFVRAADANVVGDVIQLGTGAAYSIAEIFEMACEVSGVKATAKLDERRIRPDASEVLVLLSDPNCAKERLGWSATTSLREGLTLTSEWLKQNMAQYNTNVLFV
jgi:UDP-glucose 4-epimerase